MTRSELISRVAERYPELYQREVERVVNTIFNEIAGAMSRGDRVELRGFGAFSVKHRAARTGRNPRTGSAVAVEAKWVPFFKTGKQLRERLNSGEAGIERAGAPSQAAGTAGGETAGSDAASA